MVNVTSKYNFKLFIVYYYKNNQLELTVSLLTGYFYETIRTKLRKIILLFFIELFFYI